MTSRRGASSRRSLRDPSSTVHAAGCGHVAAPAGERWDYDYAHGVPHADRERQTAALFDPPRLCRVSTLRIATARLYQARRRQPVAAPCRQPPPP